MDKLPNYFKRNKKFLLCWGPFFIISIVLLVLCNIMYGRVFWERYCFSISRIVFDIVYVIVMHIFLHKTDGKFSKYKIDNQKINKRDKVCNSILLLLPIIIILLTSIFHFFDNQYYIRHLFNSFHIDKELILIDFVFSVNAGLLSIFAIYMYLKDKLNFTNNNKEVSIDKNEFQENDHASANVVKAKKISKNKRRIAWAFIWRYVLLFIVTNLLIVNLSDMIDLTSGREDLYNLELHSAMEVATSTLYLNIPIMVVCAIVSFIIILFGSMIVNKIVAKKIAVEEQNKKFITKSVSITLIVFLLGCICYNTVLFEYNTISIMKTDLHEKLVQYYEFEDIYSKDSTSQGEKILASINSVFKNFDIDKMMDFYYKFFIPFGIICGLGSVILTIIILRNFNKLINNICVDNTLDSSGNIVPTQSKLSKEFIKMIIIISIVNIVVFVSVFIVYKVENYEPPKYGRHVLLESTYYNEYSTVSQKEEEEINNNSVNEVKLKNEDSWYLNNNINVMEAGYYRLTHPEYSVDEDYILSKYDEAIELFEKIKNYKNIEEAESALGIKFSHTSFWQWTTFLDGKNLLTGVGVKVITDSFSDKNILDVELYDADGILNEHEKKQKIEKLTIDIEDLRDKIYLLYEDMTIDDLISILGDSYIYEEEWTDPQNKYDYYTWYDKLGSYLKIELMDGVIHSASFWNNNQSSVSEISQVEMEEGLEIKFYEPEIRDYYVYKDYYYDEQFNKKEIDVKYKINDMKTKFSLVIDEELKDYLNENNLAYELDDNTLTINFDRRNQLILKLENDIKYQDDEALSGDVITFGEDCIITSDGIAHYIFLDPFYNVEIEGKSRNKVVGISIYDDVVLVKEEDGLIEEVYNGVREFDIKEAYADKLLDGNYTLLKAIDVDGNDITEMIYNLIPECRYNGNSIHFFDYDNTKEKSAKKKIGLMSNSALNGSSVYLNYEVNKLETSKDSAIAYIYYDIKDDTIELKMYMQNGDIYTYTKEA